MGSRAATPTTTPKTGSPVGYLKIMATILFLVIIFTIIFIQIKKHKQPTIKVETKKIAFIIGEVTYYLKPGEKIRFEDTSTNIGGWSSVGYSPLFTSDCTGNSFRTTDSGQWDPENPCSTWIIENDGDRTISITYRK